MTPVLSRIKWKQALPFLIFALGVFLGWMIWALSPAIAGHIEPWDADSACYMVALFFGGYMATLIHPPSWWLASLGIYVGQVAYCELWYSRFLPPGDPKLFPSLVGIAIFGMMPALIGTLFAWCAWSFSYTQRRETNGR